MKNVIITGASRGIGFALVKEFLKNEETHVYVLTRNTSVFAGIDSKAAHRLSIIPFDITNFIEARLLSSMDISHVDLLINNAGYLVNKSFLETEPAEWQQVFDTNFFGVVKLIKTVYPLLQASGAAHIVNIGSMGGYQGSLKFAGLSAYSSSKGALAILTECLAEEFKQKKDAIACNCLCPGSVNTEMLQQAFPGYTGSNSPEEMAQLVYLFATDGAKFFNGKIIPVSTSTP